MKRQAMLTRDQAKHFQFDMTTSGLEVDRIMEALNRLDQTDALVEQIQGDRAKLEHMRLRAFSFAATIIAPCSRRRSLTNSIPDSHGVGV